MPIGKIIFIMEQSIDEALIFIAPNHAQPSIVCNNEGLPSHALVAWKEVICTSNSKDDLKKRLATVKKAVKWRSAERLKFVTDKLSFFSKFTNLSVNVTLGPASIRSRVVGALFVGFVGSEFVIKFRFFTLFCSGLAAERGNQVQLAAAMQQKRLGPKQTQRTRRVCFSEITVIMEPSVQL